MILPLIIGISILIIVSVFSMSAISSNRQLKSYGIYSISGGTRSDCVLIQIWNIFYCCVLSCVAAYIFYNLMKLCGKLDGSIISFGKDEATACAVIIILTLIASAIMPTLIIGKSETKDILREEEM
jgi:hypothetical protein